MQSNNHELFNDNKEFVPIRSINRKPLREWGYEQAGLNRGDANALESHLRWIKEGHLVDETTSADDEVRRKRQIEDQIISKEKEHGEKVNDMNHINDVVIVDKEAQIKRHNEAIEDKNIKMSDGMIESHYSQARFWLYLSLCILISIYLIFFYASAINASFFRSMQQLVNSNDGGDITLMLNSIFDINGILSFGPQSIFTYLGAFIFFGFGLLPHVFSHQKSKFGAFKIAGAISVCFVIDSLLAYKIDSGIHELKTLMGIADQDWVWYKSVNFYLVLAFGFGTYMLWGFIYEATLSEHSKKNVNARVEIEIKGLKKRIREIENEIIAAKKGLSEMQNQIDGLKLEIGRLKKDLDTAMLKPEELLRNMENFYAGWLGYLNGISENNIQKPTCEQIYRTFNQSLKQQLN
jgi:hypothetical protein